MLTITVTSGEIHISESSEFANAKVPLLTLSMREHLDVLVEVGPDTGYEIERSTDGQSVLIS